MRYRLSTLSTFSLLALAAAGCAAGITGEDCPDFRCVGFTGPVTLAAELDPPSDFTDGQDNSVRQEIAKVEFNVNGTATVRLAAPVTLGGQVLAEDGSAVPSQVVASRPSVIPGRPSLYFQAASDNEGRFRVSVPPGDYEVRVVPQGAAEAHYPPMTAAVSLSSDQTRLFKVPAPEKLVAITGRVTTPLGDGLVKARVRAVDPRTGLLRSSVATVGESGDFMIHLAPDVLMQSAVLVVATSPAPTDPVLTQEVVVKNRTPLWLRMPAVPKPVTVSVPVWGAATSGSRGVAGAYVEFTTDLTQKDSLARATLRVVTSTDAEGRATAQLVPGSDGNRVYEVTVSPPADSPYARKVTMLEVGPNLLGGVFEVLELSRRPQVIGRVVGGVDRRQPIADAVISPLPLDTAAQSLNTSTTTDGYGQFVLHLEPGSYTLEVVPPPSVMFARTTIAADVSGDGHLPDVVLPTGTMAQLTVLDPRGRPAEGVEVHLYAVEGTSLPCSKTDCTPPARRRASGVSDASGTLRLLLAAP